MTIELAYFIYAVLGIIAGVLGGLLGIGGGVITVPCLFYLYQWLHFPQSYVMHMAIGTSLAAMIFTSAASTWAHHQRKGVLWSVLNNMVPGLILGSIIGVVIAIWLSGVLLEVFFGIFLCVLAFRFYRQKPVVQLGTHLLPNRITLHLVSGCIGMVSNLLGIGGGSLAVPVLTSLKIADKQAIGTSAAMTLITSLLGSIFYLMWGWGAGPVPDSIGLIHLPSFLIMGITTSIFAPYGAKLAHQLAPQKVRKIFALVLAITGLSLVT